MSTRSAGRQWPALAGERLQRFLQEGFDFAFVLDDDARVVECVQAEATRRPALQALVGRVLADGVSVESRPKVPELLASDCLRLPQGYRWRHVNLVVDGEDDGLPVLLKLVLLGGGVAGDDAAPPLRVVIGRDLSHLREMQRRFVRVSQEFELAATSMPRVEVGSEFGLQRLVGHKPLDHIVSEAVSFLERSCITLALARSQGDHRAAALLLGLALDDFNARYESAVRG